MLLRIALRFYKRYTNWPTSVTQINPQALINPQMLLNWPFIISIPTNVTQINLDVTENFKPQTLLKLTHKCCSIIHRYYSKLPKVSFKLTQKRYSN